jgi:hypothetical protein
MKRAIMKLRQELSDGMVDYMQDDEDGVVTYTQPDIDRCAKFVDEFLAKLERVPDRNKSAFIMKAVETFVVQLNKLNEACEGGLIETDQREQLCALIVAATRDTGLAVGDEDITEKWRDW